ncbi:DUF4012 domain-containing protein [Candidatus Peregrinibacteria bacterium]|nr:DUF4012 domain-containing protein [Candidatus Peregrinibacteria bacterium]MBT4148653.1 DUF4012 domain-containing protein [Candidatus Peregrinibacteria bacterium]MBT4366341.1 DUF4012 domain-containing protein [Candidatus Peregrinibacteria bacterium]MBT4456016.1 DUF4012 domain-containing protein [Candidatus Peregrinibacteria bacterium]
MSNKKTENITSSSNKTPINLSGETYPKHKRESHRPNLKTKETPGKKIEDISFKEEKKQGTILKVKESKTRSVFGNLLKIGVSGFIILFLINSVNIYNKTIEAKEEITYQAFEGYSKLLEGSKNTTKVQFTEAKDAFENALSSFREAESTLWFIAEDDTLYAEQSSLGSSAKAILESGKYFAKAGEYFTESLEELNKIPIYFVSKNEAEEFKTIIEDQEEITEILKRGTEKAALALVQTTLARDEMEKIDEDLVPIEVRGKLSYAKEKINQIIKTLESIERHFPAVLTLLGDVTPHRYLVILQNNAETRPTGGFIGSYGLVTIDKGVITELKVEDVYDLSNDPHAEDPPSDEIYDFFLCCRFRNVNYSPDFFYTGKMAAWMLEQEGGPEVDTVIGLNQSSLKDFLEVSGPIQVGDLPDQITAENYIPILTYVIEAKIWGKEDPKHILKMMVPEFKKQIFKTENVSKIMGILYRAAQQKQVIAYSKDSVIESFFDTLGISGKFKQLGEKEDFLAVIHTSDAGNKTEHFIEEAITHVTNIEKDGTLIDELTVARTHTFGKEHQAAWNNVWDSFGFDYRHVPGYVVDIMGRATNIVKTRIYVPEGAILLESTGISKEDVNIGYDSEVDRTYFDVRISTPPQNTSSVTLKYKLPFKLDFSPVDTYSFSAHKQPGSIGSVLTKTIQPQDQEDDDLSPYVYYPEDAFLKGENKIIYATNLVYDRYFSSVWGE